MRGRGSLDINLVPPYYPTTLYIITGGFQAEADARKRYRREVGTTRMFERLTAHRLDGRGRGLRLMDLVMNDAERRGEAPRVRVRAKYNRIARTLIVTENSQTVPEPPVLRKEGERAATAGPPLQDFCISPLLTA